MTASFLDDWRSPPSADELDSLERDEFALEFLRRNPDYRRDYARTMRRIGAGAVNADEASATLARRWGLRFRSRPASLLP